MSISHSVPRAPGLRSALSMAISGLLLSNAWAESPVFQPLPEQVVTASRVAQPLSEVLANMTVIGRDTIDRAAGTSVADVLRGVQGFEMVRNGGPATTTSLFLRGAEKRHVLVLIDGVPFESQTTSGGAGWEALPLALVDRIEVLRGPASAMYGSSAVAGVVQIFTKQGAGKPQASVGMGLGTQDLAQADVALSGHWGAVDAAFGAAGSTLLGPSSRLNAVTGSRAADRDGQRDASANLNLGWRVMPGHRLSVGWLQNHSNSQYDASTSSKNDDRVLRDLTQGNLGWQAQWAGGLRSQVSIGQTTDRYQTTPSQALNETSTRTASALVEQRLGAHTVRAVVDHRRETFFNLTALAPAQKGVWPAREDLGVSLGHEWRAGQWGTDLAVRQDDDSEFGRHHTGHVGARYQLAPGWQLTGSWGTAFKAPTLYQRFSYYSTAGLQPESSRTTEFSLKHDRNGVQAAVTAYDTRIDHLTDFVSRPAASGCLRAAVDGCYMDLGQAHLKGVELMASAPWLGVRWQGSVDLGVPKRVSTDALLDRRARQRATLRAESEFMGWQWGVQAQAQSYRMDAGNRLAGYTVWSADLSRALDAQWKLVARLDNLTDRRYELARNYSVTPRAVFVGIRFTPSL
jgi:vitamin B12 transporter